MITKKIKKLSLFIIMLLLSTNSVLANTNNNIIDFEKNGTAKITLKDKLEEQSIEGVELTIKLVAFAKTNKNNLIFIYHNNIKNCEANLTNLKEKRLADEINSCITEEIELPQQTKITDENGMVKFENLELGLYLVSQTNNVSGYSNIEPFLMILPIEQDNKWIYDIEAKPKTDIIRLMDLTVEKVWNTGSALEIHPKEVTIELYKGEQIIDTVVLNKENNWTHTWKQIEKSDEYKVIEINIPDEYTVSYREDENKFIVTNTKTLVQTGMNLLLIETITGLGLIFIIIGIVFEKRNKYE